MTTFAVIGGDARQTVLASVLEKHAGRVERYGSGDGSDTVPSLGAAVEKANAVILPVPATRDGNTVLTLPAAGISIPFASLAERLRPGVLLTGGLLPPEWCRAVEELGGRCADYYRGNEVVQLKNALPTAEGAIRLAMEALPVTLFGATVAVVGYGRIGALLTERLTAFGAKVWVFARSPIARASAKLHGAETAAIGSESIAPLSRCRAVFNTVPSRVMGAEMLQALPKGCVLIELASAPGGFDPAEAANAEIRVIPAPGLPGRFYPETAGEILAEAVCGVLSANDLIT